TISIVAARAIAKSQPLSRELRCKREKILKRLIERLSRFKGSIQAKSGNQNSEDESQDLNPEQTDGDSPAVFVATVPNCTEFPLAIRSSTHRLPIANPWVLASRAVPKDSLSISRVSGSWSRLWRISTKGIHDDLPELSGVWKTEM